MSSIAASLQPVPRRQYVSTGNFTGHFFAYEKDAIVNGVQTYILNDVAGTYLKGAILRENGRKLIKGVNPGDSNGELVDGAGKIYTYLVGVINTTADPNVAGFIDPNCSLFAPFNTDKPYFLDSPDEVVDVTTNPDSQAIGAPVYTHGDITTTAGEITAVGGTIGYSGTGGSVTQTVSKSTGVTLNKQTGFITMNNATLNANTQVEFVLTNSFITTDHMLLVNIANNYRVVANTANGSATIYVKNISGGNLSDSPVIQFVLIKSITA